METIDKKSKKATKKVVKTVEETPKKISKTGLAMRRFKGILEIVDMKAVLR